MTQVPIARVGGLALPFPANEIEIFTEIRHVLLLHQISPFIAALISRPRIIANAVQADFEVRAALGTDFAPAG